MVFQGAVERTTCMDQKDDVVRNVALKSSSHSRLNIPVPVLLPHFQSIT